LDGVGRTGRQVGLVVLAGAVWLLVAGEVGWVSRDVTDRWFLPVAGLGALCFAVGALGAVLEPLRRRVTRGRCARCGAWTERGQVYCLDHLRETVHEAQDTLREIR
jgi:hypothetical protein